MFQREGVGGVVDRKLPKLFANFIFKHKSDLTFAFWGLFFSQTFLEMMPTKFYSNETVFSERARGIFRDINVHLRDKF